MLSFFCRLSLSFILLFAFADSISALAASKYDSVERMIADQKVIRVLMDDSPNYGNQSATINLMNRLRQLNFKGVFEVIYPDEQANKIIKLFNLPSILPDLYFYEDLNHQQITFMRETYYLNRLMNHTIEPVKLGVTGGHDQPDEAACIQRPDCEAINEKFADLMNADTFLMLQPWTAFPENDHIYIRQSENSIAVSPPGRFWVYPVTHFADSQAYLGTSAGQILLKQTPALQSLMDAIEKKQINVLPVYGWSFRQAENDDGEENNHKYATYLFPKNILQVITGARYAQLHGRASMHNPLIVAVFSDYAKEVKELNTLLAQSTWEPLYEKQGGKEMRAAWSTLGLNKAGIFQTALLSDADAGKKITSLKPGQVLLLSMGTLPKVVFDGLYADTHSNIWPQIREGEGSLSILLMNGRPHLRCLTTPEGHDFQTDPKKWELGLDSIQNKALKDQLATLYGENGFCENWSWIKHPGIYQQVGHWLIEGQDPHSAFSGYFTALLKASQQLKNDRIYRGLEDILHTG